MKTKEIVLFIIGMILLAVLCEISEHIIGVFGVLIVFAAVVIAWVVIDLLVRYKRGIKLAKSYEKVLEEYYIDKHCKNCAFLSTCELHVHARKNHRYIVYTYSGMDEQCISSKAIEDDIKGNVFDLLRKKGEGFYSLKFVPTYKELIGDSEKI